jgi:hypothetical protein
MNFHFSEQQGSAKIHPLGNIVKQGRRVFLELGLEGRLADSGPLLQPLDHRARKQDESSEDEPRSAFSPPARPRPVLSRPATPLDPSCRGLQHPSTRLVAACNTPRPVLSRPATPLDPLVSARNTPRPACLRPQHPATRLVSARNTPRPVLSRPARPLDPSRPRFQDPATRLGSG